MDRNRVRGWISKRYNITLFFLESEKRREIRFSALSLAFLVFLFVFLVFANALLVLDYSNKANRAAEAARLEERVAHYQLEFRKLQTELRDMEDRMVQLQLLDTRLRRLAHLDSKSKVLALGGPENLSLRKHIKGLRENTQRLIVDVRRDLFSMRKVAEEQEETLHVMEEFLRSREALLTHTPIGYPVRGWVTSPFGYRKNPFSGLREFHEGVDIAAAVGTPVRSPADGVVIFAGKSEGYGNLLIVDHGYGYSTAYGHCSKLLVKNGDRVVRGQIVALVGNTGRSTAPHLHYEVRVGGVPVNPGGYLRLGQSIIAYRD